MAFGSNCSLLYRTKVQLVVFCTTIEAQIIFEILLALILPLLASLKEKSTHGELDCFLGAEDRDSLKEDNLADEATRNIFVLS